MAPAVLGIVMVIIAIIGAYIMIIYLRKYANQERMAMIEKGVDPQFFNVKKTINTSWSLRVSLLLMGAGIGLLLGNFLENSFYMDDEVAYFSMLFIFGGIGLGISYLIEEKKQKAEEKSK